MMHAENPSNTLALNGALEVDNPATQTSTVKTSR